MVGQKTRWFLDTEFNEDGRTIELISIALVGEDGREYYAVSADFDPAACNDWVKANVLPLLPMERRCRSNIADDVRELLLADGKKPEIWAYFADYDWVALCQLFGPMVALPKGFPMFCMDLKQLMKSEGIEKADLPAQSGAAHDALADARWVRDAHRVIAEIRTLRAEGEARGWVKCSERMPLTGLNVIVDGGIAFFDGQVWRTMTGTASGKEIQWTVTHWMPLPAPPLPSPPEKGSK